MAHVEGYTPLEPHGYLTGDCPNGRVVTEDRACPAWPGGVACAVFACGVHGPATGSLTPGDVLCCAVRQLSSPGHDPRTPEGSPEGAATTGQPAIPEPAGRSSRRHETRKA